MFLHSPVLDTIVFVMCLLLFRELVVGDETANEDARLLMKHSKLWGRFGLWIILFLGVSYITLSDFWVLVHLSTKTGHETKKIRHKN